MTRQPPWSKPCTRHSCSTRGSGKKGAVKWRIRNPQLVFGALALLLAIDALGTIRIALACAALHECGHIAVYRALRGRWPVVELAPGQLRLAMQGVLLPPQQELLLAAAGIFCNALCAVGALALMQYCIGYSYRGYWFVSANILLGGVNLLPLGALDGARLAACLKEMYGARRT